jgi:hypothetical protein
MSVYSGFATRALESSYNRVLGDVMVLMQGFLVKYLKKGKIYEESADCARFSRKFNKIFKNLKALEQQKHLKPMFTHCLVDLAELTSNQEDSQAENSVLDESQSTSFYSHDHDFQILNDGLAYDDTRVHRFIPSKLQTVLEKPAHRFQFREKTHKLSSNKHSSPEVKTIRNEMVFKKLKKRMSQIKNFQNRALTRLDYDF